MDRPRWWFDQRVFFVNRSLQASCSDRPSFRINLHLHAYHETTAMGSRHTACFLPHDGVSLRWFFSWELWPIADWSHYESLLCHGTAATPTTTMGSRHCQGWDWSLLPFANESFQRCCYRSLLPFAIESFQCCCCHDTMASAMSTVATASPNHCRWNPFIGCIDIPLLSSGFIASYRAQYYLGTCVNSTSSVFIFLLPVELSHLPTIQVSFGCDGADGAFRDDQDDYAFFWVKELPHAFPLVSVVAFACLFPITSGRVCCVSSDNSTQQQMFVEPSIHPPWCDCFYLGADSVILSTISIPSNLLQSWVVTNPRFFWLWHNLIGYWLVVMLLGSSQRSSLARQLVIPPIFQPVHLVHNLLQAFRPLFRMKFFSFWSRLLSFHVPLSLQHTCAFWNHHNPLAYLREGEPKEWCKRSFLDRSYVLGFNLAIIVLIIELFIYL